MGLIRDKSFDFALDIIKIHKMLVDKREFVLSKQILRSGTAIGALVRESEHAESKKDFIHKLAIAQKEANETEYWLELLFRSGYIESKEYNLLLNEIQSILRILASIIITSKKNMKNKFLRKYNY